MPSKTLHGSCLCGAIAFEVSQLEAHMAHCHCSMCRKFHGAAFSTFGEARVENFVWIRGQEQLAHYTARNGSTRSFCPVCGSSLLFKASSGQEDLVEFALGCLDDPISERPDAHVFLHYKANWSDIHDALPKFTEGRDSEEFKG